MVLFSAKKLIAVHIVPKLWTIAASGMTPLGMHADQELIGQCGVSFCNSHPLGVCALHRHASKCRRHHLPIPLGFHQNSYTRRIIYPIEFPRRCFLSLARGRVYLGRTRGTPARVARTLVHSPRSEGEEAELYDCCCGGGGVAPVAHVVTERGLDFPRPSCADRRARTRGLEISGARCGTAVAGTAVSAPRGRRCLARGSASPGRRFVVLP